MLCWDDAVCEVPVHLQPQPGVYGRQQEEKAEQESIIYTTWGGNYPTGSFL